MLVRALRHKRAARFHRPPKKLGRRFFHSVVLRKRRAGSAGICRLASKLLLECRIGRRSAPISRPAGLYGQKPFAIDRRDDEDQRTVAGQPSSHAYLWPEVRDDKSLSARRWRRASRGARGSSGGRATG